MAGLTRWVLAAIAIALFCVRAGRVGQVPRAGLPRAMSFRRVTGHYA
ncbi:hypothetical protein BN979_02208 [Mycolicibacterium vulneris]|nr:hypothetical protein BN979_02208 [Mycolicibacterium vulneris]